MTCSEQSSNQKAKKQKDNRGGFAMLLLKGHVATGDDAATKFLDNMTGWFCRATSQGACRKRCNLWLGPEQQLNFFTRKLFIKYLDPAFLQS